MFNPNATILLVHVHGSLQNQSREKTSHSLTAKWKAIDCKNARLKVNKQA